jgi:quinol monooxygenase YgiN
MKVLAVTIRVKADKIEEARGFFRQFLAPSRAEAGCVQYDLFQCDTDPQVFYFFEKWASDEAFKLHSTQPFLVEFRKRYPEILEVPNQILWLSPVV